VGCAVEVPAEHAARAKAHGTSGKPAPVPPTFQQERLQNIQNEDVQGLISNLANFDDMHLAMTTSESYVMDGSYEAAVTKVAHLFRVRRLLAIEGKVPGTVGPVIIKAYEESLRAWPAAYRDWTAKFYGPPTRNYEPLDIDKTETRAIVATYFLGESVDSASLKVLLNGYESHQKWIGEFKRTARNQAPVPPAFTLYAIHRLVTTIPDQRLTPAARVARDDYRSWANDHVSPPVEAEVSAWNAARDEGDPFEQISDPKHVSLRDQPKMKLRVYPLTFKDGTALFDQDPGDSDESSKHGEEWRKRLLPTARAMLER